MKMPASVPNKSIPTVGIVIGQLSHGGAEKQVALLARGLQQSGRVEPVVFCLSGFVDPYGRFLQENGIRYFSLPEKNSSIIRKLIWLVKQLKTARCDLMYGILNVGNIYAGLAAAVTRVPYITSIRNADAKLPAVVRVLSRMACQSSRLVIANSRSCVDSLADDLGVTHNHVCLIPNAILSSQGKPGTTSGLREGHAIPRDATLVGTVALLKAQKRAGYFIEVCKALLQDIELAKRRDLHFIWIGNGPEASKAISLKEGLPAEIGQKIHFIGARNDVDDCLADLDLFVLTSQYEGMPNALLEAMGAGLPCVATHVVGTQDVLDGLHEEEIGVLAPAEHPEAFAAAVKTLLLDPERMKRMGENARQHVLKNYSLEAFVASHIEAFCQALPPKIRIQLQATDT